MQGKESPRLSCIKTDESMDQPVTFSLGDSPAKLRVYVTDIAMDSTEIVSEEQSITTVNRMHKEGSDLSRPNCVSVKKVESVDQPDAFSSGDSPAKLRVYITDVALDSTKIMSEEQSIKTVTSSIQEESAESSCVSIRSDESMDGPDSTASQNSFL